jgi:clan AA aspartic protease
MSLVRDNITLINAGDTIRVECGLIKEPEIRETTVQCLVDTGAWTLVINEAVRAALGLRITDSTTSTFANGSTEPNGMCEPVKVCWKDRSMTCEAVILPDADEVLLGAIPLEGMDLMVDPVAEKLVGRHGDTALYTLK